MLVYVIALLPIVALLISVRDKLSRVVKYKNVRVMSGNVVLKNDDSRIVLQPDDYAIELEDKYIMITSHIGIVGDVNKVYVVDDLSSTTRQGLVNAILRRSMIKISLFMMLLIPFLSFIKTGL